MKERPILFSGPMVRAILSGTKTQTRRVVKLRDGSNPDDGSVSFLEDGTFDKIMDFTKSYPYWEDVLCPYGQPGDRLWVRETFRLFDSYTECGCYDECRCAKYHGHPIYKADEEAAGGPWKRSIHMPRQLSRITLEVTAIRVERLQAISPSDCDSEGIRFTTSHTRDGAGCLARINDYQDLWESINGPGSWAKNPWVWVIEFKRIKP